MLCKSGAGVNVLNVENLTIKNNTFYNNGGNGIYDEGEIFVAGFANGHKITDWLTGAAYNLVTKGTVLSNNRFQNAVAARACSARISPGTTGLNFANSLNASSNKWYDPTTSSNFLIVSGKKVTLGGWQSATGTDYSSSWSKTTAPNPPGALFRLPLTRTSQ